MVTKAATSKTSNTSKPIPVTLLSGFLGSGKTTLLENILTTSHGYKIAVIINDVSQLNIDAALIQNHKVTQKEEKLIQMQNGCICCTLRGDLLEELCSLATSGEFQYIVIESTGISEPMQVAETFSTEFSEMLLQSDDTTNTMSKEEQKTLENIVQLGGLHKLCQLDTCVTVIDSLNFLDNFETTEFLADRYGDNGAGETERTITDLMVDQIEFSDVIILNKISTISKRQRKKIKKIIHSLNPVAKLECTDYCKVPIGKVINTGLFDFEKVSTSAGWLQSINQMTIREGYGDKTHATLTPKPETEEYGINNFIYRSDRPFHPERLHDLIADKFVILERAGMDENELTGGNGEESDEEMKGASTDEEEEEEEEEDEEEEEVDEELVNKTIIKTKKESIFANVLRSKGFFWLATRHILRGEWSSAGTMMSLNGGIPWFVITGTEGFDKDAVELIKKDMKGKYGDRRNEIVFLGLNLNKVKLSKALDECLLNDEEFAQFEKIVDSEKNFIKAEHKLQKIFEDGFEDWLVFNDREGEDEDEENGKKKSDDEMEDTKETKKQKLDIHVEKHGSHSHVKVN
ncbi:unnamed protein product [Ambrosiozyma monospora]|uniref:Unnamed protein product n=1 Tax=Ambrosiozyma monospora TaxID=43982 RepID=A0A9W6YWE2_AMBMO|nr:unnamed protein product [Ambrosiozyma monospora]